MQDNIFYRMKIYVLSSRNFIWPYLAAYSKLDAHKAF
jgi:hypothetical protein